MQELDLKHFKPDEFRRCTPSCDISKMNPEFLVALDTARDVAGVPFVLTSAYRSPSYDLAKGRSGSGYHTQGRAVDVACGDSKLRWQIVCGCLAVGLSVGLSKDGFVHIDNRRTPIVFLY